MAMNEFTDLRDLVENADIEEFIDHEDFEDAFEALCARDFQKDDTMLKLPDVVKLVYILHEYEFSVGDSGGLVLNGEKIWVDGQWEDVETVEDL